MAANKPTFKFPMHDIHLKKSLRNVKVACVLAVIAPLTFYFLHNKPKTIKYQTFYSNYDPMKSFERMRKGGYLSSCPAEDDSSKKDKKKKK